MPSSRPGFEDGTHCRLHPDTPERWQLAQGYKRGRAPTFSRKQLWSLPDLLALPIGQQHEWRVVYGLDLHAHTVNPLTTIEAEHWRTITTKT